MENPVIIFGAKGLGRTALEIFTSNGVAVYGFLEDDATWHGKEIDNVPVLGSTEDEGFLKLIGKKCDAFVAVEDAKVRKHIIEYLKDVRHVMPCNAIHSKAYISPSASLGHGTMVNMGVHIGAGVTMGQHIILHAGAIIEHGAVLGDEVQIGTGAIVGAEATIGKGSFIGSGALVVPGLTVGKNAQIGAGSVLIQSLDDKKRVFGNPAKEIGG